MESSYHLHIKSDDRVHPDADEVIKALHHLFEEKIKESGFTDPSLAGFSIALCVDIHEHAKKRIEQRDIQARQHQKATEMKDKGRSNASIAQEMGLSESTVRRILDPKLGES